MGYYIQVPKNKGKAEQLAQIHGAMILPGAPESFSKVPVDKALICVVDNGPFEAAAFCYSEQEFKEFSSPDSLSRPSRLRTWLLMDRAKAEELSGFRSS